MNLGDGTKAFIDTHTINLAPHRFLNSCPCFAIVTRPLFPVNKLILVDAWTNTHPAILQTYFRYDLLYLADKLYCRFYSNLKALLTNIYTSSFFSFLSTR